MHAGLDIFVAWLFSALFVSSRTGRHRIFTPDLSVLLQSAHVDSCWACDVLSLLVKATAMARAIPLLLLRVPLQHHTNDSK